MKKRFTGKLTKLEGHLGWRVVDVPFDVKKAFGKSGTVPVAGTVNGFEFQNSVFPRKNGKHFLLMNKQMQRGAGVSELGDKIEVEIELDQKKRTVAFPSLLKKELEDEPELIDYFKAFSYSMRKYFSDHINSPKSPAVRKRRAQELAEVLFQMKEGETYPPPILEAEFTHNPTARRGWMLMSVSAKRGHLWGIHYYKPGEARDRRIAKAIEAMVAHAKKKEGKE